MYKLHKQRGIGIIGVILLIFVIGTLLTLGMKLVPPYIEYMEIQKAFRDIAANPDVSNGGVPEVDNAFSRYSTINDIKSITKDDIVVDKSSGTMIISADYSVKVPVVANVSLVVDFHPSSAPH